MNSYPHYLLNITNDIKLATLLTEQILQLNLKIKNNMFLFDTNNVLRNNNLSSNKIQQIIERILGFGTRDYRMLPSISLPIVLHCGLEFVLSWLRSTYQTITNKLYTTIEITYKHWLPTLCMNHLTVTPNMTWFTSSNNSCWGLCKYNIICSKVGNYKTTPNLCNRHWIKYETILRCTSQHIHVSNITNLILSYIFIWNRIKLK